MSQGPRHVYFIFIYIYIYLCIIKYNIKNLIASRWAELTQLAKIK